MLMSKPNKNPDGVLGNWVLPLDMVENSTSPLQTHLRPDSGDEAVQTDHLILEGGSIRALLRVSSPISLRHDTAPTSGFHASQAETDGKGYGSTSRVVQRRLVLPAAIAGVRCR